MSGATSWQSMLRSCAIPQQRPQLVRQRRECLHPGVLTERLPLAPEHVQRHRIIRLVPGAFARVGQQREHVRERRRWPGRVAADEKVVSAERRMSSVLGPQKRENSRAKMPQIACA